MKNNIDVRSVKLQCLYVTVVFSLLAVRKQKSIFRMCLLGVCVVC